MKATRPVGSEVLAARLGATLKEDARRGGGTAVVVDLEPVLAIHVAARLNQLRLANAVLVLPRWPYQEALLPVDGLLGGLVTQAARLTPGDLSNVVFVLDAQRSQAVPRRSLQDRRADNRYRLTALDLPNLAALRARDIRRVITVTAT